MTAGVLRIAAGMELPADAVTQTFGVLAKRGVGKTYTAKVLTEEMIGAGGQVVVLDPLDAWWGLRSSSDGKKSGLGVYVFGGEHADLPLEPASGKLVADVVVEQGISCVLSLRHLSKSAQRRFVADFAERLYERKGEGKYRTPLHVVIDEADAFAPQRVMGETARMLGAIDDLVRRGRSSGLGVTLITQRAAALNKDVLTQIEVLIAMRTISPQDRKAVDEWIVAHDSEGRREEFMKSLASLDIGEAWIWSPGWLDVFKRVKIRTAKTYDSSSTPKAGAVAVEPSRLAPVDLGAIREKMAAVVEDAEANDPKKLRARIRELEGKLVSQSASQPVSQACGHEGEIAELREIIEREYAARQLQDEALRAGNELRAAIDAALAKYHEWAKGRREIPAPAALPARRTERVRPAEQTQRTAQTQAPARTTLTQQTVHDGLTGPEQRILNAIAWWEAIGVRAPSKQNVGFVAGYRVGKKVGGHYGNTLGALRADGLIEYPTPNVVELTIAGRKVAEAPDDMRTLTDLQRAIFDRLDGPERKVLQAIADAWPEALTKQEAGARAGYQVGEKVGGHYGNVLGALRTLGLVEYPTAGMVSATELLFPEGLR